MHIYGKDYIKYLNDERSNRFTYEQWKNRNGGQDSNRCIRCQGEKKHFQPCPRCQY